MKKFSIGDIVRPIPGSFTQLRSGAAWYSCAVVISEEPLMIVSVGADMLWSTTTDKMELEVCGRATPHQLKRCFRRLPDEDAS
jgi:hypothetical protein